MLSSIEEQIRNYERQLIEAIRTRDLLTLDELLHDDLLFLNQNGQIITKATDLATYQSGKVAIWEIIPSDLNIKVLGDAVLTTQLLWLKGKYEQQLFAGQYRYLRAWQVQGDRWQVIAGACSLV